MDAQATGPEMPKLPAPPCQGGHPGLPRFPGLAPWAFLPDPCGVLLSFPELVRFLTAYETIELQCQVCPAAGAWRCRPKPPLPAMADYLKNARRRTAICL